MSGLSDLLVPGGALASPIANELLGQPETFRELRVGDRVGPYRIRGELGRGGMSIVYRADRADGAYVSEVALKLLRPEFDAETARDVLQQEREVLARLEHPGVARLIDGGSTEEGWLWFAMERVEGERIDDYVRRHQCALETRLALFLDVCATIQYAHARLLIHRDIKESNILVGVDGRTKLLDFGVAGLIENGATHKRPHGMTPRIASPEQQRGEVETTATDIFQLGLLLSRLLSGPLPTRSDIRNDTTLTAGETTIVGDDESSLQTSELQSEIPRLRGRKADLAAIAKRAMQPDRHARYASVAGMAHDIRAWLIGKPVSAVAQTPLYLAKRFVARHAMALAIAMMVVFAFAAIGATSVWRIQQERDVAQAAQRVAETERAAARREAIRAESVTRFLVDTFRESSPTEQAGHHLRIDEMLASAPQRIDDAFADQPGIRAELLAQIGYIQFELGNNADALPLLEQSVQLARADEDLPELERVRREAALGIVMTSTERTTEAQRLLEHAVERLQQIAPASVEHQLARNSLAVHYARLGDPNRSASILRELVPSMLANPELQRWRAISAWGNLAAALFSTGDENGFYSTSDAACRAARDELGAASPVTIGNCSNALLALVRQKRYAEAEDLGDALLAAAHSVGASDTNTWPLGVRRQMTFLALEQGHWPVAEQRARAALAISERLPAENDSFSTDLLGYLALAVFEQRKFADSLVYAQRAYKQDRDRLRISFPDDGVLATFVARAYAAQQRCADAERYVQEARRTYQARVNSGELAADVAPAINKNLDDVARRCATMGEVTKER
jgi:tRNA A-37 threonylcarbamoyl transferase component Bud32/tetratricopeptide (TPR) repeat protein